MERAGRALERVGRALKTVGRPAEEVERAWDVVERPSKGTGRYGLRKSCESIRRIKTDISSYMVVL